MLLHNFVVRDFPYFYVYLETTLTLVPKKRETRREEGRHVVGVGRRTVEDCVHRYTEELRGPRGETRPKFLGSRFETNQVEPSPQVELG